MKCFGFAHIVWVFRQVNFVKGPNPELVFRVQKVFLYLLATNLIKYEDDFKHFDAVNNFLARLVLKLPQNYQKLKQPNFRSQ